MKTIKIKMSVVPPLYIKVADEEGKDLIYKKIEDNRTDNIGDINIISKVAIDNCELAIENVPVCKKYYMAAYNMDGKILMDVIIDVAN